MSEISAHYDDSDIIQSAYAEKVVEAFKIFADGLSVGQNERECRDRFLRSLELVRKARDLALIVASGAGSAERAAERAAEAVAVEAGERAAAVLSAEDQALVDKALEGTRGSAALRPIIPGSFRPRR
jgi:hypothetical protein